MKKDTMDLNAIKVAIQKPLVTKSVYPNAVSTNER